MAYNPKTSRAGEDITPLRDDADTKDIINSFNLLADRVSFYNKLLTFSNFNGYISSDIIIPANSSATIQHFLGVIPKYRIILKQTGNGVITDVNDEWTTKYITLYNNGAVPVTITVFIARE